MKYRMPTYNYNGQPRILVANGICLRCETQIKMNRCACSIYPAAPANPLSIRAQAKNAR
jgi:hypothetical protein